MVQLPLVIRRVATPVGKVFFGKSGENHAKFDKLRRLWFTLRVAA
jgi:hypothetical protein